MHFLEAILCHPAGKPLHMGRRFGTVSNLLATAVDINNEMHLTYQNCKGLSLRKKLHNSATLFLACILPFCEEHAQCYSSQVQLYNNLLSWVQLKILTYVNFLSFGRP